MFNYNKLSQTLKSKYFQTFLNGEHFIVFKMNIFFSNTYESFSFWRELWKN